MYAPRKSVVALMLAAFAAGCEREPQSTGQDAAVASEGETRPIGVSLAEWDARLTADDIEQGRLDPAWRRVADIDTTSLRDAAPSREEFAEISRETVNTGSMHLPLAGDAEGPSVLRLQILLDRALFSPGVLDGRWGKNTEKALYWFQTREGLPRTAALDEETFDRLAEVAGGSPDLIRAHQLTSQDVEGPFVSIPEDIYEQAELDCLCYESIEEKLAELFHTTPELLQQLNPEVDLLSVSAGETLQVPAVRAPDAGRSASVARVVVSAQGFYVHALDASGRILFHFPSTLGSTYDPSPSGSHTVASITFDPWWHYQPEILAHIQDDEPDAHIPPGPNSAVGLVWMDLSIEHYGIHGTSAPETIGYATSAGCVRLTNWDAVFLAERIREGIPVEFTDDGDGREATG